MNDLVKCPTDIERRPRWTSADRDFWCDLFESYSGDMLRAQLEDGQRSVDFHKLIVQHAAQLADAAILETQFRFWNPKRIRTPRKRRKTR